MEEDLGKRARRSTRYSGDFQVQDFDVGSSDEERETKQQSSNRRSSSQKGKRTKECPGCGAVLNLSVRECRLCDYQFTSKSLSNTNQSAAQESSQIRERFPFEPERDDEGSLIIQSILGRRPRLSGRRLMKGSSGSMSNMTAMDAKYEFEYLIKYKNLSYLHTQWLPGAEIEAMSQKSKASLNRYLTKIDRGESVPTEEDIEPSYTEVEKVMDYREEEVFEITDEQTASSSSSSSSSMSTTTAAVVAAAVTENNRKDEEMMTEENKISTAITTTTTTTAIPMSASSGTLHFRTDPRAGQITADGEQVKVSVTQIFQPVERCRRVLEKLYEDPYSSSFQDPVDVEEYTDYLEVVEEPMCFKDVRTKLDAGEYSKFGQYTKFAQDIRKIWRNCKLYNLYKSQIWHSAHCMGMLFERLYQAWVVSFSDGSMGLDDPVARPWELSCRGCLQEGDDNEMMLCDHCDANHHIYCLKPPLKKVPEDTWICPRCVQWFARSGAKVLSATAEDEARLQLEGASTRKVVKVRAKKYLVKWRGLSYRECTWETAKAINDDQIIADFHRVNDNPPEEPPLTQAEIGLELSKDRKSQLYPAGINSGRENPIMDVDAQIYAQIRAYHFVKWNKTIPEALLRECGPSAYAFMLGAKDLLALPAYAKTAVDATRAHAEKLQREGFVMDDNAVDDADEEDVVMDDDDDEEKEEQEQEQLQDEKSTIETSVEIDIDDDDAVEVVNSLADSDEANAVLSLLDEETKQQAVIVKEKLDYGLCWYKDPGMDDIRSIVAERLSEAVYAVARDYEKAPLPVYPSRPRLPNRYQIPSEIEVCVAKGNANLFMRVGNFNGNVVVVGFKPCDMKGTKGPVERTGRVKIGDILVAIDGLYVHHLMFKQVLTLLKTQRPYVYLRFLRIPPCIEAKSKDLVPKYMSGKATLRSSHRPIPLRSKYLGVYPLVHNSSLSHDTAVPPSSSPSSSSSSSSSDNITTTIWTAEYFSDYEKVIIGTFDEEILAARAYDAAMFSINSNNSVGTSKARVTNFIAPGSNDLTDLAKILGKQVEHERQVTSDRIAQFNRKLIKVISKPASVDAVIQETESTVDNNTNDVTEAEDFHSYDSRDSVSGASALPSPDESEDEEEDEVGTTGHGGKGKEYDLDDEDEADDDDDDDDEEVEDDEEEHDGDDSDNEDKDWMPSSAKEATYEPEGPIMRLLRAVNESDYPPTRSDWTKYILELAVGRKVIGTAVAATDIANGTSGTTKGRKVHQIDMASGHVVRTWDTTNAAARNLSLAVSEIHAVLAGKTDSAGGFKWEYLIEANQSSEDIDDDDDDLLVEEVEAKKEESWKLKLPKPGDVLEYRSGGTLRDYQIEGLSWLLRCWYQKRSCILADEMGLGKTVQVVTFLDHLYEKESIRGPFLICVPLSTIGHWKREFDGWSHMVSCMYHDIGGGRDMRDVIREYEWYYKGRSRRLLKFHVLITTYDDLVRDYEELAEVPWRCVIVDEAHRLRNVNSKLLECFRSVVTKGQISYGYQHRILMTGTPLQNNTVELWSLMNFIEPAKFPDLEKFQARFGTITTQEQVEQLQKRIAPHLLRRVKEDVAKDIPPKEETIIDVELTTMQKQYYRAIFEHNHAFLMQNLKGNMPKLMNIQMELRKCCNHPFLINGVEILEMENLERNIEDAASHITNAAARSKLLFDQKEFERRRMDEILIPASGKMVLLDKLLPKLYKEGHKVLIFSQMVKMIDFIDEFCEYRKYNCERLDGRIAGNDRQKSIDRFNRESDSFVFLLSTRAGGVGINLTAADTVIIFDSDWNPQNDIQAMARCHRIGQKKSVTIYRLITRRSFESEMFDRASKKLGLEQAVLGTRNFTEGEFDDVDRKGPKIDAKEMEQLLREGAYAVLLEDDAEIMKEFYEQDIDNLLKQRSHVLVTEDGSRQTESWLNKRKKLGKTSKHMFTGDSAKEHAEIDVNDPDFWKKVLPDLVTPDLMLERLQDESLTDEEDVNRDAIAKYMKDLAQMMEGMLDLSRRNTLPERERAVCLKLLLRITLKDDVFDEYEILQAQEWLSVIEGARSRRGRTDLYTAPDHRKSASKSSSSSKSGRGHGSKGPSSGRNAPRLDDNRPNPVHHNELESERKSSRKTKGKSNARRWGNRFGSGTRNLEDIDLEEGHQDDDDEVVGDGNDSDDEYGDGDATVKKTSSKSSSSKSKGKANSSTVKSKAKAEPSSTVNKNRNAKRRRSGQDDDDGDDDDAENDDDDDDGGEEMTPAVKKKQAKRSHKKVVFKKSSVANDKDFADDDRLGVEAGEMEEVDGVGRGVKMTIPKKRSRKPSVAKRLYSRDDDVDDHDYSHADNDEGDRDDKDEGGHDDKYEGDHDGTEQRAPVAKASRKSRSRASFLAPVDTEHQGGYDDDGLKDDDVDDDDNDGNEIVSIEYGD